MFTRDSKIMLQFLPKMSGGFFERLHVRLLPVYVLVESVGLIDRLFNVVCGRLSKLALPIVILAPCIAIVWGCIMMVRARDPISGAYKYRGLWRHSARVLALLAAVGVVVSLVPSRVIPSNRLLLLADVEDETGDPNFPAAGVKTAFLVALVQSGRLGVLPPEVTGEVLQKMGKPRDERITEELGKQICIRAGIGPLILLRVKGVEETYTLSGRVISPTTGQLLGQSEIQAVSRASLTQALGHLAQELRREFGDTLYDVRISSRPLAEATTSSIDALKAYSEAQQLLGEGVYKDAQEQLNKALQLDSDFAMAWTELASLYEYQADIPKALACLERAYKLRDRLTEVEKARVEEYYYELVLDDPEGALSKVAAFVKNFPKNSSRLGTLDDTASRLMRFHIAKDAEEKERMLLQKPSFESTIASWSTELSLGNFRKAVEIALQIRRDWPVEEKTRGLVRISHRALGDFQKAEAEIEDLPASAGNEETLWIIGLVDLYKGRLQSAREHWLRYLEMLNSPASGSDPLLVENKKGMAHLWVARVGLLKGETETVREHLNQVAGVRDEYLAEAGKYYARIVISQRRTNC